jgi:hypothetical protein
MDIVYFTIKWAASLFPLKQATRLYPVLIHTQAYTATQERATTPIAGLEHPETNDRKDPRLHQHTYGCDRKNKPTAWLHIVKKLSDQKALDIFIF